VVELNQTQLAMDHGEADQVLSEQHPPLAAGLTALANGWPAVIGLAGVTRTSLFPGGSAPEELYAFFADEIYRGLDVEVQIDLGVLIVATTLDREVAAALLGTSRAARSIAETLAVGILDERGTRLDFHPLARTFVEARTHPDALLQRSSAVDSCLRIYRDRRDWDSAFELIERSGETDHLDAIIPLALDSLLESGRLATIEALMTAVLAFAAFMLLTTLGLVAFWSIPVEMNTRLAGSIASIMNFGGNFGGFFSPMVAGSIVAKTGDWSLPFYTAALGCLLGALVLGFLVPVRPIPFAAEPLFEKEAQLEHSLGH